MSDLLFDTPWWLLALLLLGGGAIWFTGNQRLDTKLKSIGAGIFVLGVLLALVSHFVDTDREKVTRNTRDLVAAVNDREWTKFESLLDPKTSMEGVYNTRADIVDGARKTADTIGLKSVTVTSMEVKQVQTVITVDINVMSEQDVTLGRPMPTSWRFDWRDSGTGWKLFRIEPLEGAQVKRDDILGHLVKK